MTTTRPRPLALLRAILASALLLALALPGAASAHDHGATSDPALRLSRTTVPAGSGLVVRGRGFGAKARIEIRLDDVLVGRHRIRADRHGRFVAFVRVPVTTTLAEHPLAATGTARDGTVRTATTTLTVTAALVRDGDGEDGDDDGPSDGAPAPTAPATPAPTSTPSEAPTPAPTPTPTAVPTPAPTPVPVTGSYAEGLDVSHWQGTIDWAKVAKAGKSFAYIKASESTTFVDPLYATNRAKAKAAGLRTGAYHFARPSTASGDAVAEARWFLKTAAVESGDLVPVVDLETTGGLGSTALTTWLKAFVGEVYAKTGVRPAIYVSPAFWSSYLGNTSWFAANGYRILWVAHWTTGSKPTVPGNNWGGHSWTFWQYTSGGSVNGITGRVDLDRYNGTDFSRVLVP